ncbi:PAS domain S-box protein [Roseibacterium beibuensis]|uniref:PAS domain S-box protein n=1 Tax=[Roseibacterium] beibuensis TaxID=1193142 RepID=UPI00217D37B8|nr:PAS domain S-box protein [Roseibacterium beibuensis]MCS6622653.1 PAS domain S-box protein [Roseibacterium beibuensis]
MSYSTAVDDEMAFLAGGGEVGALMRSHDWSASTLGHPSTWPQSLRSVVGLLLHSKFPMFVAWGDELGFLYNDPYAEVLGSKHPQALGRRFHDIWAEIWPDISPLIDAALAGEGTFSQNLPLVMNRQGFDEQTWFTFSYSPVHDERGKVAGMFCVCAETTGQVLAEAALTESETRFRGMADNTPVMMWVTDPTGYCTYMNARWYEFTGQAPRAGEGYGWLDAVHPDDRAIAEAAFVTANAEQKDYLVEFRVKRADGVYRWTLDAAAARFSAAGDYLGYVGSVIDIDERREMESALRQANDRLEERVAAALAERREVDALHRAYFENSPEALFVIGVRPDGGFVVEETNPAHEAALGMRLEDIRGRGLDEILPPALSERIQATYRHVIETGAVHQYREEYDLDGEAQHWDTSLVPMRNPAGRIVRLIGSSRNVTRQVVAEEALRQSQKMDAMGQLTGGVAHDFNNLLTPIVGALDMLQRRGLGGERERRLIEGAAQSAERAKLLVQRLLAFARRQPLQPVAVDVGGVVRGMADLVASTTGPQIKVVVETPPDLPPALADTNQLEMALLNLAVNARDAMPNGGTLRISASLEAVQPGTSERLKAGRYVRVSVADTGSGMDEATLARAVEPFFSTKGIGQGTGLGLSMAHGLASQLGGALLIASNPGLGTNVELWLPQTDAVPEAPATPTEAGLPGPAGTVLLVDDEAFVRLSTVDMLSDLGYRVIEAASAEEALRLFGDQPVDLVVTDHLMPGMTGTELARALRETRPDLTVLLVSGFAEVEGAAPDLPRLTKPFRKDELAASIAGLSANKDRISIDTGIPEPRS